MEKEITLHEHRLAALEKSVASLTLEKKFEAIGGKKVEVPVSVKGEKEIRFEHLGGRCILRSPFWVDSDDPTAKPAGSVEKDDDARE